MSMKYWNEMSLEKERQNKNEKDMFFYCKSGMKRRLSTIIVEGSCEYSCSDIVCLSAENIGNRFKSETIYFQCPLQHKRYGSKCYNAALHYKQDIINLFIKYFSEEELFELLL